MASLNFKCVHIKSPLVSHPKICVKNDTYSLYVVSHVRNNAKFLLLSRCTS